MNPSLPGVVSSSEVRRWLAREEESLSPIKRPEDDLVITGSKGIELHTADGRRLMDFTGGYHVSNLGYSHPDIAKATKDQIDRLDFSPHYLGLSPIRIELAEKLRALAPRQLTRGKVAYCNTGSDAAEFAIKLARYTTGRHALVACMGAYHGGTIGGLSITFDSSRLRKKVGPLLADAFFVSYPNLYRSRYGSDPKECASQCLAEVEELFMNVVDASEVAAFFVEPIQAHGGVIIPPVEYLTGLRKLCSNNGILLVVDEVVTGFGRTGKMFGIEHFRVEPDVMFFGKPMGAGLPLGALLGRRKIMESWNGDGPASTLAASTLACARCLSMINVIERDGLLQHSNRVGRLLITRFSELAEKYAIIGDVRGKGLLVGVELVRNRTTKQPAAREAKQISEFAYKHGILISSGGGNGNVLKLSPPLIVTERQTEHALGVIESALSHLGR